MSTLFSRIISGELPGRFVWKDERCVAFLTIAPLRPGHALVVPREEIDEWTETDDSLLADLMLVAKRVGAAQRVAFNAPRAGLIVAGFEVPHVHVHVFPSWGIDDFDFDKVDHEPDPAELDAAATALRTALCAAGNSDQVPD
ncbi:MAG: HIT family protein [Pseudonocardiaceae bacterium]